MRFKTWIAGTGRSAVWMNVADHLANVACMYIIQGNYRLARRCAIKSQYAWSRFDKCRLMEQNLSIHLS